MQSQVCSGKYEIHRRLSEAGPVQICTIGKIPLAAAVEEGPEGESRGRESQVRETGTPPSSAHCHEDGRVESDPRNIPEVESSSWLK